MRVAGWIPGALFIAALTSAIALQAPSNRSGNHLDVWPDTGGSRRMTPAESAIVRGAIDSIATPPPDSIFFHDTNGVVTGIPCANIAYDLYWQLEHGRIRVDTADQRGEDDGEKAGTDTDGKPGRHGDVMNFLENFVNQFMADSTKRKYIEEILVHERMHKRQTEWELDQIWYELIPMAAESGYKAATALPPTDPEFEQLCSMLQRQRDFYEDTHPRPRPINWWDLWDRFMGFFYCASPFGPDTLISYELGDLGSYRFPLTTIRASDMMVRETHPLLPPGVSMIVICGGAPIPLTARIQALTISNGEVTGTFATHDFGPPAYPPMFFYAATYSQFTGFYYMLDTLNQQILTMTDANHDSVPDEIIGTFAAASSPGFAPLDGMRGINAAFHRTLGFGLLVNHSDISLPHDRSPEKEYLFLPDVDGLPGADACLPAPLYQFITLFPAIMEPLPWAGESSVMIYGSWNRTMGVWITDESGQMLLEQVGLHEMLPGIEAMCPLSRPLVAGEYVLPVEIESGNRPDLPTEVLDPVPRKLTICYGTDGVLHLRWTEVEGALFYRLYVSDDAVNFFDTGLITPETWLILPAEPEAVQFYRITAVR